MIKRLQTLLAAALTISTAQPAAALVVVTDNGLTAPTLGGNDTGYTGTTNQRFGWDNESFTQSFTASAAGTISAIYIGYNAFDNGDTLTMTLSVNGSPVVTGLILDGNNFSGTAVGATPDGNAGPFYWMKFDLSTENVPVTAGSNTFSMTATAFSGVSWALAPRYNLADVYPGGALTGLPTTGDLAFAVAINPLDDTDNDDLSDRWELSFPGVLDLTYLDGKLPAGSGPGSATGDFDGDGLSDFDEWNGGVNSTNPTRTDTDDDGYSDLAEDGVGSWLDLNFTGTSPLNPDTDGDGLMDGEENPNSGTLGGPVHECDPNKFDSDGDLYGDGDEVAAGNDPVVNTSVPTDIPFRNVNFSGIGGGWETVKGTTLDSTTELLAGSGQYALIEGATSGNGLRIEHVNPNLTAIPASTFYCSVDLRAVGTLGGGTGSFNILSTSSPLTSSDGSAYCILRVFDDGSVQAFDGTAFQSVVAAGGIVAGTTYTAQIDHNIVAGTWSSRVYNRTTGALIGSITNVPVRPTSDPNAASMNFTVSAQDPNANWDVAVDNMILSLARITVPTAGELRITAAGFNGSGEFVIDFIGTDLTDYEVTKSLDLQAAFAPLGIPLVVTTDASGIGQATVPAAEATTPAAFFRMEEQ